MLGALAPHLKKVSSLVPSLPSFDFIGRLSWLQRILLAFFITVTGLWIWSFISLFSHNDAVMHDAIAEGAYARIILENGEVEGNIPATVEEALGLVEPTKSKKKPSAARADELKARPENVITLNPAPNERMVENSKEYGALPRRDDHGAKPWNYYARPSDVPKGKPVIAFVVSGIGLADVVREKALSLPADISLSVTPYAKNIAELAAAIRGSGHELWLDIPMQFSDYPASDPGPLGLLKDKNIQENMDRTKRLLGKVPGYVGLIGSDNEVFSADKMMGEVHAELSRRGLLMLLRSRSFHPAKKGETVLFMNRHISRGDGADVWNQKLSELESIAKSYGYAVGVIAPTPGVLEALHQWIKKRNKDSVAIVPLSAIVERVGK